MAKLKINFQDLAFAFLNDDPDIDPHLNLENGELIDNSSNYYGTSVTKYAAAASEGEAIDGEVVGDESEVVPDAEEEIKPRNAEDEAFEEMADFDKFIKIKPLSLKGNHSVISEFLKAHSLEEKKELTTIKYIKDFDYIIRDHSDLRDKWLSYKNEKLRFIATRWMEMNKVRADLI